MFEGLKFHKVQSSSPLKTKSLKKAKILRNQFQHSSLKMKFKSMHFQVKILHCGSNHY